MPIRITGSQRAILLQDTQFLLLKRDLLLPPFLSLRGGGTLTGTTTPILSSMLDMMIPAFTLSFATWLLFALDIYRQPNIAKTKAEISTRLRQHRREKLQSLRQTFLPLVIVLTSACIFNRALPWQTALWKQGPSAFGVGLNFAYWAAEITMDSALDECQPLALHMTAVITALFQFSLISLLTTNQLHGHVIFLFKAAETILATSLARLIDHVYWLVIAVSAVLVLCTAQLTGHLAPLPKDIPPMAAAGYFGATLASSTLYQLVQNLHPCLTNIKLFRAVLLLSTMVFLKTPASWILYDIVNFFLFFAFKIVTDSVALQAIQKKSRLQEELGLD